MHQRFAPFQYHFKYKLFSLKIDIDQIANESRSIWCLSLNKFNLISLHNHDFGSRDSTPWRQWFEEISLSYGVNEPIAKIELVCMPRYLGYRFNPLAMWYGYDQNNQLVAIIAEVSNTFGQWHHYVLTNNGLPLDDNISATAEKAFHVSPFMSMNCQYRFKITRPSRHFKMGIYELENDQKVLNAVQVASEYSLNTLNLLKVALKMPLNSLKVIVAIHWWAIKIWFKGGKFHKTPGQLKHLDYSHTEMNLC